MRIRQGDRMKKSDIDQGIRMKKSDIDSHKYVHLDLDKGAKQFNRKRIVSPTNSTAAIEHEQTKNTNLTESSHLVQNQLQ